MMDELECKLRSQMQESVIAKQKLICNKGFAQTKMIRDEFKERKYFDFRSISNKFEVN